MLFRTQHATGQMRATRGLGYDTHMGADAVNAEGLQEAALTCGHQQSGSL